MDPFLFPLLLVLQFPGSVPFSFSFRKFIFIAESMTDVPLPSPIDPLSGYLVWPGCVGPYFLSVLGILQLDLNLASCLSVSLWGSGVWDSPGHYALNLWGLLFFPMCVVTATLFLLLIPTVHWASWNSAFIVFRKFGKFWLSFLQHFFCPHLFQGLQLHVLSHFNFLFSLFYFICFLLYFTSLFVSSAISNVLIIQQFIISHIVVFFSRSSIWVFSQLSVSAELFEHIECSYNHRFNVLLCWF